MPVTQTSSTLRHWILVAMALGASLALPARAVDVNGSLRAWTGSTSAGGIDSNEGEEAFRLALTQSLTPWLTLTGSFRANRFRANFGDLPTFERSSEQPEIGLNYDRRRFSARLLFSDRAIRTTDESQDLDIRTFLSTMDWNPTRGPRFGLRYQNSTSTADAAAFGRDTESSNLSLRADYSKANWNARYSFDLADLDNRVTGLSLEQSRHELRTGFFESILNDRWSFALDARYADVNQKQSAPAGAAVALAVPVVQGLFAIDSTPSLGELEPAPELVDGDTTTAAAPGIELGGASTFRNIGVDLGISRPISELEITVDAPSGPILWEVWESPDNSSWFRISAATSSFDAGFLRYSLRFPETTNRFFKAVNVSVNVAPETAVTEVRALIGTTSSERTARSGSEYWVSVQSSARPIDRVELTVAATVRREEDLVATELRRNFEERGLSTQIRADLHSSLQLRLGYRLSELDESVDPVGRRDEEIATAALEWRPLDTLDILLTAQQRDETDDNELAVSTDSLILQAVMEILPELILNSTLAATDTVNELVGFSQETRYLIEAVEARPNDRWLLGGTFARYEYDSIGRVVVSSRTSTQLRASWFATPFLSLSSEWLRSKDDVGKTDTQRLSVQWSPGPKLSLSTGYFETDSSVGSGTASLTFDGSYKMNRWFQVWVGLNEAETSITPQERQTTEALRVGISAIF